MNIQHYILPEWKQEISNQDLPDALEQKFIVYGESMAEYLDRFMMRSLPENWYEGWTRYKFPLATDSMVLDMYEIIANNFGAFVNRYRNGKKDAFSIKSDEIEQIQHLEETFQATKQQKAAALNELRADIAKLRKPRTREHKRVKRHQRQKHQKKTSETPSEQKNKQEQSDEKISGVPDHDLVYKKWMEMVESKPISKSYWHIHNYLAKYILDFAKEHTDDGLITKQLIEDFLEDYGKGKRPKTMNHYNRVVYRFWEFYENLISENDDDPMEVW